MYFLFLTHIFGHSNILGFTNNDGSLLRPGFRDATHMDEHMIDKWNSVVKHGDKVYHLGDVAMGKQGLLNLYRCNGNKVLIKGNHDKEKLSEYVKYFKDVRGSHQMDGILMTHIPVHPNSLARWPINIHGHLHSNQVTKDIIDNSWYGINTVIDPRYLCVSVEQLDNYTPISLEDLRKVVLARQEKYS